MQEPYETPREHAGAGIQVTLDAVAAALIDVDEAGVVRDWNAAAEGWLGVARAAAVGEPLAGLRVPHARICAELAARAFREGEEAESEPLSFHRRGVGERYLQVAATPHPAGALLTLTDVTSAAAARARSEARALELEQLRDLAVAATATLEPAEIFDALCAPVQRLMGAELAGVIHPLLGPQGRMCGAGSEVGSTDRLGDVMRQLLAHNGSVSTFSPPIQGVASAIGVPLHDDGEIVGALVVGWVQGTERADPSTIERVEAIASYTAAAFRNARMYQEMKESAVRRDRFFSAMSHDLRTPITAIVGYSELLQDGIAGDLGEQQQEMVERICQVSGQLSHLVNDIMDLAKLDAGRMEFHLERTPLGDLLEEAVVTVQPQADAKGLSLRLDTEGAGELELLIDLPRVRQILVNLLSNAVKFTERGEVCVSAGRDGKRSWIAVEDTGPGLPEGSEETVFEEFLQLASGNKHKREPGSGLGLAISRRLARAMGGDLVARSNEEVGATFTLFLRAAGVSAHARRIG